MPYTGQDRTRDQKTARRVKDLWKRFIFNEEPAGPLPPIVPPVDEDTYVYETPEGWSFAPQRGDDVFQLQSERGEATIDSIQSIRDLAETMSPSFLWMPPIPQRPVKSYSIQLRLTGRPTEKRSVLAWAVAGTGRAGDNSQKFSDLAWEDRKGGKIRWHQGFGVQQREQTTDSFLAPWAVGQDEFSVLHSVKLVPPNPFNGVASPWTSQGKDGEPPIGDISIPERGVHVDLGDQDGNGPVGATYVYFRLEINL